MPSLTTLARQMFSVPMCVPSPCVPPVTILIAPLALVWLVNHPDYRLPEQGHVVLYGTPARASTEEPAGNGDVVSDVAMTEESDDSKNNLFISSNSDWANETLPQIR